MPSYRFTFHNTAIGQDTYGSAQIQAPLRRVPFEVSEGLGVPRFQDQGMIQSTSAAKKARL
ncbi:hypothetical protein PHLCEN_2v3023 [Hermanssonia centrifuga]|uniref:Uncharacterized protein n=1 Tax=Hermanssonia centrifuga TaxID=98765 RepID=A0A2R6R7E0_9APHY|nr:hypothetical protein PHLCEN_2v3023 [Hermanssonia centrifuga]